MSALSDRLAGLDGAVHAHLGDPITYTAEGGEAQSLEAIITYEQASVSGAVTFSRSDAPLCEVLKSDVPVKPTSGARITVAAIPGTTFAPYDVRESETREGWIFALKVPNR